MEEKQLPLSESRESLNISVFLSALKNSKWLFLLCIVIAVLLGGGVAFMMPKQYEAKVIATFANQGKQNNSFSSLLGQFGGAAELAGLSIGGGGSSQDAYLAYLNSRAFLDSFIEKYGLVQVIFAKQWDDQNKTWKGPSEKVPTPFRAYQVFSKQIFNTQYDKKTGIIAISVKLGDRDLAVRVANKIVEDANSKLRSQAIDDTRRTLNYLEDELKKTSIVEVQNTIYRIMEVQVKTMMIANTQEQFAFKIIDPAVLIDADNFVSPRRGLIVSLAAVLGLVFGVLVVLLRNNKKSAHSSV